ncbi:MFS transporter [Nocardia sp. CA2R105]|uniref:MFS transporter n=1 Tax=Nocardia coffeae TaxID=2873381 RepID=UPI001CA600A7|nr:MFS transporter [Nocardia coffeae]MBY8855306.1 MFS transporter [Nocardia coffeae]
MTDVNASKTATSHDTAARAGQLGIAGVIAVSIGNFLVAFDASAVNVALPTITRELHTSAGAGQWFLDGYTIPLCVFLMVSGAAGDRFGAAKVYRAALVVFTVASALCATAMSGEWLIAARVLQGVSASFALPMTLAILGKGIADPGRRARMIGAWGVVGGVGIASSPLLSGLVTGFIGWRWMFAVNVPICLVALWMLRRFSDAPEAHQRRVNPVSQLLLCVLLTSLAAALIEGRHGTWPIGWLIGAAGITVVAAAGLLWIELVSDKPTVPQELSHNRPYLLVALAGGCYQFASYGSLLVLALYLQQKHGLDAVHTGYVLLVCCVSWCLGNVTALVITPARRDRMIVAFAAVGAVGAIGSAGLSLGGNLVLAIAPTALIGYAAGILASSLSAAAMHLAPAPVAGTAAGLLNTSRQSGMVIAVAILGGMGFSTELLVPMLAVGGAFAGVLISMVIAGGLRDKRSHSAHW